MSRSSSSRVSGKPPEPEVVTGVQLMQGIGARPAQGFWADAWSQVLRRRTAVFALAWLGLVALLAVYAPLVSSGHPLLMRETGGLGAGGGAGVGAAAEGGWTSPLWRQLSAIDLVLLIHVTLGVPAIMLTPGRGGARGRMFGAFVGGLVLAIAVLAVSGLLQGRLENAAQESAREALTQQARTGQTPTVATPLVRQPYAGLLVGGVVAGVLGLVAVVLPLGSRGWRVGAVVFASGLSVWAVWARWVVPVERFDYEARQRAGQVEVVYTLNPWSPFQRFSELSRVEPGSTRWRAVVDEATRSLPPGRALEAGALRAVSDGLGTALTEAGAGAGAAARGRAALEELAARASTGAGPTRAQVRRVIDRAVARGGGDGEAGEGGRPPRFLWGTDKDGADVLTQVLHACRLSISIGFVSTGVALLIGVTMGALMGYFRGWVDLVLFRVVEIFMAVPVLFLLIVSVAVLPDELKTTYVMMAIIGCFTWTSMARFTRAEFLKLRNQDFVQAAQATGLPLWSVLFRHMLPNGVAPVLVDTSFAIAAAISIEATLSFLGLGPVDSASWGKLLSSAMPSEGEFRWWLAVFPGVAIFMTILSYNLLGETLRDAIDPKLKKAAV